MSVRARVLAHGLLDQCSLHSKAHNFQTESLHKCAVSISYEKAPLLV